MMTDLWLGYADRSARREVLMALRRLAPGSAVVFARSAEELRTRFHEEEPGTVGAIVGHAGDGVSDMNLAAALAHDGIASEVVLVARGASGSLRSRASRAGISMVIDATVAPALEAAAVKDAGVAPRQSDAREGSGQRMPWDIDARESASASESSSRVPRGGASASELPARTLRSIDLPDIDAVPEPSDATQVKASPVPAPSAASPQQASAVPQRTQGSSPILTVASGRGGVGKTALVALLASVAGKWGMDVAVVDLDLSCGNLHRCFGLGKGPDLLRIAPDGSPTSESMGRSSARCSDHVHLWGPCERPEMAELVMPHVATLLSYLSARFDLVLVDTSTTFTDGVAQAVQSCDRLLVVHDERSGAIASAARMSALAVRLGVARTRIVRVANLGDPRLKPNAFEGRSEVGLETARMFRLADGGVEAEELLLSGKVGELVDVESDLTRGVSSLLAQTLAELGRLPDNEAARKAAEYRTRRHRLQLFGRRKEAI